MSTYNLLYTTITKTNKAFESGSMSKEEYTTWKESTLKKMDTFLLCGRITDAQYTELAGMLL